MLHCFTHNDIPKLITVVNHLWLGNFQSIFKDVSVTYQQHNSVKMGQGQKSEPWLSLGRGEAEGLIVMGHKGNTPYLGNSVGYVKSCIC